MEDRNSAPTQELGRDGPGSGEDNSEPAPSKQPGLIFVCDPSAEAERLMGALRSRGYPVIDVLLGLLPSRLRYQVPDLVLCDADSPEVLERVREMRDVPATHQVRVIFLGSTQGVLQHDPAFRVEGHGLFFRPLDVDEVCTHIEALIGPPSGDRPGNVNSIAPRRAPVIVPSARKPYRSDEGPLSSRPSDSLAPPGEFGLGLASRASLLPIPPPGQEDEPPPELSPETRALLDRAQVAASAVLAQSPRPTRLATDDKPVVELDFDVLGALEEPLEASGESEVFGSTAWGAGSEAGPTLGLPTDTSGKRPTAATVPPSYPSEAAVTNPGGKMTSHPSPSFGWETAGPSSSLGGGTASAPPQRGSAPPESEGDKTATVAPPRRQAESVRASEPTASHGPLPSTPHSSPPPPRATDRADPVGQAGASDPLAAAPSVLARLPALQLADLNRAPEALRPGAATRALATAIRQRATGALALQDASGIRRVVLRDGDVVTAVSGAESESLVRFLEVTGDLDAQTADQVVRTLPPFGRHAGAGLIAHGHLQQEDLWPVLRAHSEWILATVVSMSSGRMSWEEDVPIRLHDEPAVFGGAAGSEVFVEAVRRAVDPPGAWEFVGSGQRIVGFGGHRGLLGECALEPELEALVQQATDTALEPIYRMRPEFLPILYALVELDVLTVGGGSLQTTDPKTADPKRPRQSSYEDPSAPGELDDPLDDSAFQARIMARRALVDEGDYFSILGVQRSATEYEITRARETLHRQLSPKRLSARNAHLLEEIELVLRIVDEAYEILKDTVRRERYRRALEAHPS